jgi:hypothetical protein
MNNALDKSKMKKVFNPRKVVAIVIMLLSFSILIYAYHNGISGRTKKGSTPGCTCHGSTPSQDVLVTINGPDTLVPGQTANYNVTITGGPLVRAGTDSSDLKILNSELTHSTPKAPDSGVVTFKFTYTAPLDGGEQTIYANGNSVNFNSANTGDKWNFAPNKTIQVIAPTEAENKQTILSYRLEQNFPNPFNPSTTINFVIPKSSFVNLSVYNILGRKVATLFNEEKTAGNYQVNFDASSLASSIYFYKIQATPVGGQAGSFVQVKKMILMK